MFQGHCELDETMSLYFQVATSSGVAVNADSLPTWRVYGPDGALTAATGSASFGDSGSVTAASNASPIVITSTAHGLSTGSRVTVSGVGGNTAANGTFTITRVSADTFSLDSSTGNGSYTSGGTWNVTGLYKVTVDCTEANGFEEGVNYQILLTGAVSSAVFGQLSSWGVG